LGTINYKKILLFLLLAFGLDWGLAFGYFALGGTLTSAWALPTFVLYMFGPAVAAVMVQKVICREPVLEPLGVRLKRLNGWWAVAWLAPPVLALAALGVSLLLPEIRFSAGMEGLLALYRDRLAPEQAAQMQRQIAAFPPLALFALLLVQGLIAGATINAAAAFGEELGWRGFLFRELAPLGFWPANALIGVLWGIWHAPLIWHGYNYPQHPQLGVVMMTLFALAFSPLLGYVRLRSRSVIAAAVMHGTLNATVGLSFAYLLGGDDLTRGLLGYPGLLVLVLANAALLLYDRRLRQQDMTAALDAESPA